MRRVCLNSGVLATRPVYENDKARCIGRERDAVRFYMAVVVRSILSYARTFSQLLVRCEGVGEGKTFSCGGKMSLESVGYKPAFAFGAVREDKCRSCVCKMGVIRHATSVFLAECSQHTVHLQYCRVSLQPALASYNRALHTHGGR